MTKPPALHLAELEKLFPASDGGHTGLGPTTMDIRPGEILGVLGPSGCGKTTLLNLIAGLLEPTGGSLSFTPSVPESPRIGYVFQEDRLLPWCTTQQNVQVVIMGASSADVASTVRRRLDAVGLWAERSSYPHMLSTGMRQRVSLARALASDPSVLLLDEPFHALDDVTAETIRHLLIQEWADLHPTVVLVTHSIMEALELCHRVAILRGAPGTLQSIMDLPGSPPRRFDAELLRTGREVAGRLGITHGLWEDR